MKWKKWEFEVGRKYDLSYVIDACERRLSEGNVIQDASKKEMVRRMKQHAPATIRWCPKTLRGWGASAFNKNCWRTVDGGPIIPLDPAISKKKMGTTPSSPKTTNDLPTADSSPQGGR
jgi:hypothetical protein